MWNDNAWRLATENAKCESYRWVRTTDGEHCQTLTAGNPKNNCGTEGLGTSKRTFAQHSIGETNPFWKRKTLRLHTIMCWRNAPWNRSLLEPVWPETQNEHLTNHPLKKSNNWGIWLLHLHGHQTLTRESANTAHECTRRLSTTCVAMHVAIAWWWHVMLTCLSDNMGKCVAGVNLMI